MWTRRAEASSRFSFNLRSSLDLPLFPFSSVPPLLVFCPLPRPFFQHPITASACCLSCGVHGWKWLGTSNHWRGEKGREVKETERERLTSIFGRKNANIINEHNKGWWPLNVPSDFFANVHTCDAYSPSRTCVPHWGLNSKLYRRVTASAHVVCVRKFIFGAASHVKGHRSCCSGIFTSLFQSWMIFFPFFYSFFSKSIYFNPKTHPAIIPDESLLVLWIRNKLSSLFWDGLRKAWLWMEVKSEVGGR